MFGFKKAKAKMAGALGYGEVVMPANDAAWPLKSVGDNNENVAALLESQHKQFDELQKDPEWTEYPWSDPEGGDMYLWTKPQIGTYNHVMATFTVDCSPQAFIDLVGSNDLAVRNTFSKDCIGMEELSAPTANSAVVMVKYWMPPPVVHRDFCFLIATHHNENSTIDLLGCAVDSPQCPKGGHLIVRGSSFWGWRLMPVGNKTMVTYTNCFDPRGWVPSFLPAWLKQACSREMLAIRAVCAGRKVELKHVEVAEVEGLDTDELEKEVAEHEAAQKN